MSKPKYFYISAKCNDMCDFRIVGEDGDTLKSQTDYVPYGMGLGGGDYLRLKIDIESGKIVDWEKIGPSEDEIEDLINDGKPDEQEC